MAEMIHFIRQVEAYCHLEVIECSWQDLMAFVQKKEGDLDALIENHRAYLDRMVKKVLLISPKAGREENLLNQVRDVFSLILQFREATVSVGGCGCAHSWRLCLTVGSHGRTTCTTIACRSRRGEMQKETLRG